MVALLALDLVAGPRGGAGRQPAGVRGGAGGRADGGRLPGGPELPEAGRTHIDAGQQPGNWNSNPPTSGDHLANWLQPGVYDGEQDPGPWSTAWSTATCLALGHSLLDDQLAQLRQFAEARDGSKLILAPYSGLPQDGVALAAWRNLEVLQRVNIDVVQAFVNDYMVPDACKSQALEPNAARSGSRPGRGGRSGPP